MSDLDRGGDGSENGATPTKFTKVVEAIGLRLEGDDFESGGQAQVFLAIGQRDGIGGQPPGDPGIGARPQGSTAWRTRTRC